MKTAGIVAEYNPFHKGHALHLARTRAALGPDGAVVCVMSGNFVQRGEPAVFEKHVRAAAALEGGADLVLELPLPWVLSSAEGFAFGAVSLLEALGVVDCLSFGSESGDLTALRQAAELLESPAFTPLLKTELGKGLSFAAARQGALEKLTGRSFDWLKRPNDILAVEYLRALARLGSRIEPLPIPRSGPAHDGAEPAGSLLSASAVRRRLLSGEDIAPFVPTAALARYELAVSAGRGPVGPTGTELSVLTRLRSMTEADFAALPDVTEGLHRRFFRAAGTCGSLEELFEQVKTKRYAHSRIRRAVCCAWLGVTEGDRAGAPPYARVLAANERGRGLLREARGRLPVVTKPAAARSLDERGRRLFLLEVHAADLYVLAFRGAENRRGGQEWEQSPLIL